MGVLETPGVGARMMLDSDDEPSSALDPNSRLCACTSLGSDRLCSTELMACWLSLP